MTLVERLRAAREFHSLPLGHIYDEAAAELERLQAENDLLKREMRKARVWRPDEVERWEEFERLQVEVAELREDKERLDFIAAECGGEGRLIWRWWSGPNEHTEYICEGVDGQDLRTAIDAARGQRDD